MVRLEFRPPGHSEPGAVSSRRPAVGIGLWHGAAAVRRWPANNRGGACPPEPLPASAGANCSSGRAVTRKGLVRSVGALPPRLPSASLASVRRGSAAKPLAELDFGMDADDAGGADGFAPAFSGAEWLGGW
jgi:hypothetical protein